MPFVPGFDQDVFISYAHGDDRAWVTTFADRLQFALGRILPDAKVWFDDDDLRKSRDFKLEIPRELEASATIVSLVSPIYVQRPYCVQKECGRFRELVADRKQTLFATREFENELFGFRCPIIQIPENTYWNELIPGATDILFGDDIDSFPTSSPAFETAFRTLVRGMVDLLRRMRNHSTPIVVYPHSPSSEISAAHKALTRELHDQSYRVLPEDEFDPIRHVSSAKLAVLLLDSTFNQTNRNLVNELTKLQKQFVIWPSPSLEQNGDLAQLGFLKELVELEYPLKNLFSPLATPEKLKEDVLAIIRPEAQIPPSPNRKPVVYLVFDPDQSSEKANAGQIVLNYQQEFHFESNRDPRRHTAYLTQSDGVLLVWGNGNEKWCGDEFEKIVGLSRKPKARGLCFFDPQQTKQALAQQIRSHYSDICVAEQYGAFDRTRLEPFFEPIRQSLGASI